MNLFVGEVVENGKVLESIVTYSLSELQNWAKLRENVDIYVNGEKQINPRWWIYGKTAE